MTHVDGTPTGTGIGAPVDSGGPLAPPPAASHEPETAAERVAVLILQATQQAAQAILNASTKAAADIAQAATNVPTALSTPPVQGFSAEEVVNAFERLQSTGHLSGNNQGDPFNDGIDLPYDPELDILVDQNGTRWNPEPGEEPEIPSPERQMYATVPPGTPLVPQLPRFDT